MHGKNLALQYQLLHTGVCSSPSGLFNRGNDCKSAEIPPAFERIWLGVSEEGRYACLTATCILAMKVRDNSGIIFLTHFLQRSSQRFYPTRLAVSLATGSRSDSVISQEGFILVETNYRLYAYTCKSNMGILQYSAPPITTGL